MTPATQPITAAFKGKASVVPALENGDHLSREEFMRRYEARLDIKKAELIGNMVYIMASPLRESHSAPDSLFAFLLTHYAAATPFVAARANMTVNLSQESVVQPDWYLRIETAAGGQARIDEDDYLSSAPELVVEIALTTASYDLHTKKDAYQAAGAKEYLVWQALDHHLSWFALTPNGYAPVMPEPDGIFKSRVFPGLWIDAAAFAKNEVRLVEQVLNKGLASPEHAAFVAELKRRAEGAR
jgi:Uma2 family endonuclease